jgi:hypothetical protein
MPDCPQQGSNWWHRHLAGAALGSQNPGPAGVPF